MTQEDKDLLLKYLCMALPYRMAIKDDYGDTIFIDYNDVHIQNYFEGIVDGVVRPYLRPMSSMTEDEEKEYDATFATIKLADGHYDSTMTYKSFDFLNAHHFDYRGLIEKGLAIEVTEENNPYV